MTDRTLEQALIDAGLPADAVVLGPPPEPGTEPPPADRWSVVPFGAQYAVGATGRGTFATYEALWSVGDAIDLAVRLAATPLPTRGAELTTQEREAGERTEQAIRARVDARAGGAGAAGVAEGDLLDAYGCETEHHLFALGTGFERRSEPPSRVGSAYYTFRVVRPLPATAREGLAAAWFGQPGGGAMVVLDRPIRWYVDQGHLEVVGVRAEA